MKRYQFCGKISVLWVDISLVRRYQVYRWTVCQWIHNLRRCVRSETDPWPPAMCRHLRQCDVIQAVQAGGVSGVLEWRPVLRSRPPVSSAAVSSSVSVSVDVRIFLCQWMTGYFCNVLVKMNDVRRISTSQRWPTGWTDCCMSSCSCFAQVRYLVQGHPNLTPGSCRTT